MDSPMIIYVNEQCVFIPDDKQNPQFPLWIKGLRIFTDNESSHLSPDKISIPKARLTQDFECIE